MAEEQSSNMKKLRLVANWKSLHKSLTVILSMLGFLVGLVEVILPHLGLLQPFLDPATYGFIMFGLTIAIAVGRYIQQESLEVKKDGAN
jgi:hypothetical protein